MLNVSKLKSSKALAILLALSVQSINANYSIFIGAKGSFSFMSGKKKLKAKLPKANSSIRALGAARSNPANAQYFENLVAQMTVNRYAADQVQAAQANLNTPGYDVNEHHVAALRELARLQVPNAPAPGNPNQIRNGPRSDARVQAALNPGGPAAAPNGGAIGPAAVGAPFPTVSQIASEQLTAGGLAAVDGFFAGTNTLLDVNQLGAAPAAAWGLIGPGAAIGGAPAAVLGGRLVSESLGPVGAAPGIAPGIAHGIGFDPHVIGGRRPAAGANSEPGFGGNTGVLPVIDARANLLGLPNASLHEQSVMGRVNIFNRASVATVAPIFGVTPNQLQTDLANATHANLSAGAAAAGAAPVTVNTIDGFGSFVEYTVPAPVPPLGAISLDSLFAIKGLVFAQGQEAVGTFISELNVALGGGMQPLVPALQRFYLSQSLTSMLLADYDGDYDTEYTHPARATALELTLMALYEIDAFFRIGIAVNLGYSFKELKFKGIDDLTLAEGFAVKLAVVLGLTDFFQIHAGVGVTQRHLDLAKYEGFDQDYAVARDFNQLRGIVGNNNIKGEDSYDDLGFKGFVELRGLFPLNENFWLTAGIGLEGDLNDLEAKNFASSDSELKIGTSMNATFSVGLLFKI